MQDKNKTVVKSMDLLNLFRNYPKLSLGEMVQLSGIPKTSVHRMVGSLEEMGFLKKEENSKYPFWTIYYSFSRSDG